MPPGFSAPEMRPVTEDVKRWKPMGLGALGVIGVGGMVLGVTFADVIRRVVMAVSAGNRRSILGSQVEGRSSNLPDPLPRLPSGSRRNAVCDDRQSGMTIDNRPLAAISEAFRHVISRVLSVAALMIECTPGFMGSFRRKASGQRRKLPACPASSLKPGTCHFTLF